MIYLGAAEHGKINIARLSITICTIISACASATLFALITFSFVARQQYGPINAPLVESEGRPCGYCVLGDPTLRQLFVATKNEYK